MKTLENPFGILTDEELKAMRDRAWWEASRAWRDYLRAKADGASGDVRAILLDVAQSAEAYHERVTVELKARAL